MYVTVILNAFGGFVSYLFIISTEGKYFQVEVEVEQPRAR